MLIYLWRFEANKFYLLNQQNYKLKNDLEYVQVFTCE